MEVKFNKDALIKAMKEMSYVSTQSGPIEPSKAKVIKMLTEKVPKPVSKPQDGEDWDKREYKQNDDLSYGKNLITTKTLYKKVVTEAVSNTEYRGCRLNLQSIDMKETHCKFIIDRRGHEIMVEMYYPNTNKNISVRLESDNHLSNLYEVPLDSEQFINNFGYTILKTCDELLESGTKYDLGADLDTMQFTNGMGSAVYDVNDSIVQPSNLLRESVDGHLARLRNLCDAVNIMEADEQAPGAEAFSMGAPEDVPVPDNIPGMNGGQIGADDVNGDDTSPNTTVNFADWIHDNISDIETISTDGDSPIGGTSALDRLGKMVAERMARNNNKSDGKGAAVTGDELYSGFSGIKQEGPGAIWNKFFELYSELADHSVTIQQITDFNKFLENPGTDELTLDKFDRKLQEIFPEAYGGSGLGTNMNTDNVSVDGEQNFGANDGLSGDVAVDNIIGGTGGLGGGFMNDGSTESMMAKVNPEVDAATEEPVDFGDFPKEGEDGETAVGDLEVSNEDNVADSLGNV